MENTLKKLFDYQKIANNKNLNEVTQDTFEKYGNPLDEADLLDVSAGKRQAASKKIIDPLHNFPIKEETPKGPGRFC